MLKSVLLHLERADQAEVVIRCGVAVAAPSAARVRGLTLLDTRPLSAALDCEAAVYAVAELARQDNAARQHEAVRSLLSQACLAAGMNFDVRRTEGDPLQVLAREAHFHDLVVTALAQRDEGPADPLGLSPRDLMALLQRGVQPLLVVRPRQSAFDRVLLVYDGSAASGRAIRSYLNLDILPDAEHRLLAVGPNEAEARAALLEMADYCLARRAALETGWIAGRPRSVLLPYADKWQADLLVLGTGQGNRVWGWLSGVGAPSLWRELPGSLFLTT